MKDIMNEINKLVSSAKQRWNKISQLVDKINIHLAVDEIKQSERDTMNLLLLLAEHLKPADNTAEQVEHMQQEISDMMADLNNKFKK